MVIKNIFAVMQKERVDEYTFAEKKSEDAEAQKRSGYQYMRSDVAMGGGILGLGLVFTGVFLGLTMAGMHVGSSIHMSILGHAIPPPPTSLWISAVVTGGTGAIILGSGAALSLGKNLSEDLRLRREETEKMNEREEEHSQAEAHERFEKAQNNWPKSE